MSKVNDGFTYTAVFRKERDGGYSVYFPQLDGCFTQGNDLSEAKNMAADALRLHLQGMIADGEAIPVDDPARITLADGDFSLPIHVAVPESNARRMNTNSENPKVGKAFQVFVKVCLQKRFNMEFSCEAAIEIGSPPRPHNFDCASSDRSIVVECKCYTWTIGGNAPSAKLAQFDEALLYMSFLPEQTMKIIAVSKAETSRPGLTLADYIYQRKGNLMRDVLLYEIDTDGGVRVIGA